MSRSICLVLFVATLPTAFAEQTAQLDMWAVDPLVKVFRDAEPGDGAEAVADAARGEHASFQIVVRCRQPVTGLAATVTELRAEDGEAVIKPRAPRFVGYVPVDRPIHLPPKDQLRKPPCDYPDPLLEAKSVNIEADQSQPIWITVHVPLDAESGEYTGTVTVAGEAGPDKVDVSARKPLKLRVHDVQIDKTRLWVTDWFSVTSRHLDINPERESPEFYELMRCYARNLAEHRHNVALISPLALTLYSVNEDGELEFDFSRFDKWVNVFIEEGVIGRIEGGHIGGRRGGWNSGFVVRVRQVEDGKAVSKNVDPASAEADKFYSRFLPALVNHLREKGWLERYMQHLADEPITTNADSYRALAELVHKYAPELPRIDALHTKKLVGAIDIWVPQLDYLAKDYEHYKKRQKNGDEVWMYTCVFPQGEYANRFIEQPLLKTRLLHWINYEYGITGYLHWGYNKWRDKDPYKYNTPPHPFPPYLPAGDAWIVYPGRIGPWDSIRFEAMRDGIVDHELLCRLAEFDPAKARELAARHVLDFDKYDTDIETFRSTRRELLELLGKHQAKQK